jgi:hypothetical protein
MRERNEEDGADVLGNVLGVQWECWRGDSSETSESVETKGKANEGKRKSFAP